MGATAGDASLPDAARRAWAASTYNRAFDALEAGDDPLGAVELAATSLHLWRGVGDDQTLAVGHWLLARALALAGAGDLALEASARALAHLARVADPPDWLVASLAEGRARALLAIEDPGAGRALEEARRAIAAVSDPEDRAIIEGQFADLAQGPGPSRRPPSS